MSEEVREKSRTEKLYGLICDDVDNRQAWLTRQNTWYAMRYDGIRRRNKPWPTAADMHDPMADTTIDKFKPFYFNQLFSADVIAQFIPPTPELAGMAGDVAQYFDYRVKQKSNLEHEALLLIDRMLMAGSAICKVFWDAKKGQLAFDSIEPTHFIAPDQTEDIQSADRLTIVHHYTVEQFERDPQFKVMRAKYAEAGTPIVPLIKGMGDNDSSQTYQLEQVKEVREGITHSTLSDELIIVWEVWTQEEEGWFIDWFSPLAADKPLRATQKNPFKHGLCPIVRFDFEVTDKGFYSSRGVPEKMAPFERANCAMWNNKLDWMELFLKPYFGSSMPIPNASNLKLLPGQIVPGLQMIANPARPPAFDEEMRSTRIVAESNIGVPDFGIDSSRSRGNGDVTATETKLIAEQTSTGVELRTAIFRLALRDMLKLAWETVRQYDQSASYLVAAEMKKIADIRILQEAWELLPNVSSQTWNKPQALQRAVVRWQMFGPSKAYPQGVPWINQVELTKTILELDDPRLVQRLLIDPNVNAQAEYEAEEALIPAMLLGAQFQPKPEQNQAVRVKAIMDFVAAQDQMGRPIDPRGLDNLNLRMQALMQMLQQKNPQEAAQVAQSVMQQQQQASNVIPMQPAGGAPPPEEAAPSPMPEPGGMA